MFRKQQGTFLILACALILSAPARAQAVDAAPATLARPVALDTITEPVISGIERRALTANVAEYSFKVRVGHGPHDVIGVHRVVKEIAPRVPAPASKAVFLAHGDIWNFRAAFLTAVDSAALPNTQALPVFLARNGIDVWGIDFRWTLVPATVADTSFMADWGIEQDARDLGIAIGLARLTRAATGSGLGRIHLLGWSRGGQIGYAYLNGESQLPPLLRQVRGFIPTDIYLKTDVPELRDRACQRQQATEAAIAGGTFASALGALAGSLGDEAIADPNGPSSNIPGLTARQAALLVGEATFQIQGGLEPVPFYHFTGGTFDANGLPDGLLYSSEPAFLDFLAAASPFQPNLELAEADASTCEMDDVPFDDHLDDITVPILYVGAGGGFGAFGIYTTTLLGSTDVTIHVVSLVPPAQRLVDYGHADLFLGDDAKTLVWQPILAWIKAH